MEVLSNIFAWVIRNWVPVLAVVIMIVVCLGFSYRVKSYDGTVDNWDPPKK